MKGHHRLLSQLTLAHNAAASYSEELDIRDATELLLTLKIAAHALTGGASPGVTFTLEVDSSGRGNWVAASSLIATANGFAVAAVADATITSATTVYRQYPAIAGYSARVKQEISGSPTAGTVSIEVSALVKV